MNSETMNAGSREFVQRVLRGEIGVNCVNGLGTTALTIASYFGDIESVKRLLSMNGIDINKQTRDGETALTVSSAFNHVEIVKLLQ